MPRPRRRTSSSRAGVRQRPQVDAPQRRQDRSRTGCADARSTAPRPATPRSENCRAPAAGCRPPPPAPGRAGRRGHRRARAQPRPPSRPAAAATRRTRWPRCARPSARGSSRATAPAFGQCAAARRARCARTRRARAARRCGTANAAGCRAHRSPAPAPSRAAWRPARESGGARSKVIAPPKPSRQPRSTNACACCALPLNACAMPPAHVDAPQAGQQAIGRAAHMQDRRQAGIARELQLRDVEALLLDRDRARARTSRGRSRPPPPGAGRRA